MRHSSEVGTIKRLVPEAQQIDSDGLTTIVRKRPVLLYLYLHCTSSTPLYEPYEYRFLETLCKKYTVIVAFFTRAKKVEFKEGVAPESAVLLPLRDLPLPKLVPAPIRWLLDTFVRTTRVYLTLRIVRPDVLDGNWLTRLGGLYCLFSWYHPYVATAWGSDILVEAKASRILRAIGKLTVRVADAIIVDSNIQRTAVLSLGCAPSKIYSFPWGIDLDKFKPMPNHSPILEELGWEDNKIIVSTRNHSPIYGLEYLIRAVPIVLQKEKDARFLIAGDGPLLDYHKALAEELGVQEYVRFLGRVQNRLLPDILNSADVYVSTSLSDGTSASLLEALATGLPSVITDIPANEEWVVHGVNGFLIPPKDTEALAKRIIELLENDKLRLQIRDNSLRLARERADWKVNSMKLEKCFADQLKPN